MAKKSRKARRTRKQRSPAPPPSVNPDVLRAAKPRGVTAPGVTSRRIKIDFSKEYHYVYSDLKRIAQAVGFDAARHADRLGSLLSLELFVLPLEMRRREEDDGLRSTTRSPNLPGLVS